MMEAAQSKEFNLERTLGALMEKVNNIEKTVDEIKTIQKEKATKEEMAKAFLLISELRDEIDDLRQFVDIKKHDKRVLLFIAKWAPTMLTMALAFMSGHYWSFH